MQPKDASTIQLLVQNIGGIDMTETGSIKLATLRNYTQEHQIDFCTLTECNTDWAKAPAHLHIAEQTIYWWESNQWRYHTTPKRPMRYHSNQEVWH